MKYIEKTNWQSEKKTIKKLNPVLFEAIERLNPNPETPLYRLRYGFGDRIKLDGEFHVVNSNGENVPLSDKSIEKSIQEDLFTPAQMPIGMVVNKSIELYVDYDNRVIPFNLFKPGALFGAYAVLNPETSFDVGNFWQMTSGCRSTFCTSKISENLALSKIKNALQIPIETPKNFLDHWSLFKQICKATNHSWHSEIIFFPKQWHEKTDDLKWKEFRLFLFETVWGSLALRMNSYLQDVSYSKLVSTCKNIVPNLYINRLVRHLMMMSLGACPGFKFITTDEEIPFSLLREVVLDVYKLKKYEPVFFGLDKLSGPDCKKVYYSLAVPTIAEFTLSNNTGSRRISELTEAFRMINSMKKNRDALEFGMNHKNMFDVFFDSSIVGYHTNHVTSEFPIFNPSKIVNDDRSLVQLSKNIEDEDRQICTSGPLFSGLICISKR